MGFDLDKYIKGPSGSGSSPSASSIKSGSITSDAAAMALVNARWTAEGGSTQERGDGGRATSLALAWAGQGESGMQEISNVLMRSRAGLSTNASQALYAPAGNNNENQAPDNPFLNLERDFSQQGKRISALELQLKEADALSLCYLQEKSKLEKELETRAQTISELHESLGHAKQVSLDLEREKADSQRLRALLKKETESYHQERSLRIKQKEDFARTIEDLTRIWSIKYAQKSGSTGPMNDETNEKKDDAAPPIQPCSSSGDKETTAFTQASQSKPEGEDHVSRIQAEKEERLSTLQAWNELFVEITRECKVCWGKVLERQESL